MHRTIWHNGEVIREAAVVATNDGGFLLGDGLFETLLVREGEAHAVDAHLERLAAGLARLGLSIPESNASLAEAIAAIARDAPRPFARLRVTVTVGTSSGGPTRIVEAWPYEPPSASQRVRGVDVVRCARFRLDRHGGLAGLKSTSYQLNAAALREAQSRGAYEGLLGNDRGDLVEGTRSNVALRRAGAWVTPALECGCLPGTVRAVLVDIGKLAEAVVPLADLDDATEMVLTNSLIGALPVRRLDGRELRVSREAARFAAQAGF